MKSRSRFGSLLTAIFTLLLLGGLLALPGFQEGEAQAFSHKKLKKGAPSKESIIVDQAAKGGPEKKFSLAVSYEKGKGVKKSKGKAINWYYKAGLGFLKKKNKDRAAAALAAINRLSPGHKKGIQLAAKMK